MILAWMSYLLMLAMLVIAFVGGTRVGRLQEQQRIAARRRTAALRVQCPTCGAKPGQPCIPTRHRVPSQGGRR